MASKKAPRAKFALPGGTKANPKGAFPLNTPGRIAAAPGLAGRSQAAGNISASQAATVRRKAAAARGSSSKRSSGKKSR